MLKNYRNDRCYIIAEIGGNFTTLNQAKALIDEAMNCQVDAVKLQTYRAETLTVRDAIFDMENTGITSQYGLFKKYQVDEALHKRVFEYAESKGLDWFSTPSHETDVDLLETCGVSCYKIGSDDAVNHPFLRYVARTNKTIILSTGMCTMQEVREAVNTITGEGNNNLILLHAITSYPTHANSVNLRAMQSLMREFPELDIGYSDHTISPVACLCAVSMGAKVVERHFTLDKNAEGPDHVISADPSEMKWLVDAIRSFETMRGDGIKRPAEGEKITRRNNRKSVVLTSHINAGERISTDNIAVKRPGYGIQPKYFEQLLGRTVRINMAADSVLQWEDLA